MIIISWWFIVLIVNSLFYDLIKGTTYNDMRAWLGVALAVADIVLVILLFAKGA